MSPVLHKFQFVAGLISGTIWEIIKQDWLGLTSCGFPTYWIKSPQSPLSTNFLLEADGHQTPNTDGEIETWISHPEWCPASLRCLTELISQAMLCIMHTCYTVQTTEMIDYEAILTLAVVSKRTYGYILFKTRMDDEKDDNNSPQRFGVLHLQREIVKRIRSLLLFLLLFLSEEGVSRRNVGDYFCHLFVTHSCLK